MHCLVHSSPRYFYSIVERLHLVVLKEHHRLCPILILVASPHCPTFSFGSLAFPSLELKTPTSTTTPCLLYFCTSTTATSLNFLCISFALLFDSGGVQMFPKKKTFRSPFPWYHFPYARSCKDKSQFLLSILILLSSSSRKFLSTHSVDGNKSSEYALETRFLCWSPESSSSELLRVEISNRW